MSSVFPVNVYVGNTENGFRNGIGAEYFRRAERYEWYSGEFLDNAYHGTGIYKRIGKNQRTCYTGKFYASNFEGYGLLSYPNQQVFEGLFKENQRFGPGILTYLDGTQDVGIWIGKNLVRINYNLTSTKMPVLANSAEARAYLLQFKKLVNISLKYTQEAEDTLRSLKASEEVQAKSVELYSRFVRNQRSLFFNQKSHYEKYFSNDPDLTIDVIESFDENKNPIFKEVIVTHLLAWNNNDLAISIMKHTFRHRNFENLLSYNISDILTGSRDNFNRPGVVETNSLNLLNYCNQDNDQIVIKLICSTDLYPDVTDAFGNSGLMYAALNDNLKVIQTLVNFGANVDLLNDEGLTSLLLCLLRFIACKCDVSNWEIAFLPQTQPELFEPEIQTWRNREESESTIAESTQVQTYLFDLSCVHPVKKKLRKKKKRKAKKAKKRKKEVQEVKVDESKEKMLQTIFNTILSLLICKSNVNFGEVPFPPLILSLFSKNQDIVEVLINHGADCNIRTSHHQGYLTPLHIVASLAPAPDLVSIATILLEHDSTVDLRTSPNHWINEKLFILAGMEEIGDDLGKTAVHLLCMRCDFDSDTNDSLGDLWSLLVSYGADLSITYLGHTPLTLALIRGNVRLMSRILDSGLVSPNESLGYNMGIPLTVLVLQRYKDILILNECKSVYSTLLKYGANPFTDISDFEGNAMEFCYKENESKLSKKEAKLKRKQRKQKSIHKKVIQVLRRCAEQTLVKHLQGTAVKWLYQFKFECRMEDPIFDIIARFVDLETAIKLLQILAESRSIIPNKQLFYELLQFIQTHGWKSLTKKRSKVKRKKKSKHGDSIPLEQIVNNFDLKARVKYKFPLPEIDKDQTKYRVCFQCFQKTNKELLRCPQCEIVYFCSQRCNVSSLKNTSHPCRILFYDSEKQKQNERLERGELYEEISKCGRFQEQRNQLIKNSPNYYEKLLQRDNFDEIFQAFEIERLAKEERLSRKSRRKKDKKSDTKSKRGKSKESKGRKERKRKTGETSTDTSKKSKRKEKRKHGKKGSSGSEDSDVSRSKSKRRREKQGRKQRSTSEDKEDKKRKSKRKDRDKSKEGKKARSKSSDTKKARSKSRDKDDTEMKSKRKLKDKSRSKDKDKTSKVRRSKKDTDKSRDTSRSGKRRRSKSEGKDRARSKSRDKSRKTRRSKSEERIKGHKRKTKELKQSKRTQDKSKARSTSKGKMKEDKKEKRRDESKREKTTKTKPETDLLIKMKEIPKDIKAAQKIIPISGELTQEERLRMEKEKLFKIKQEIIDGQMLPIDKCHLPDFRYFEKFIPYCAFVNGQFYYKLKGTNAFCKITYSTA